MLNSKHAIALSHPIPISQRHSTELLIQVVHYIMGHLDVDLSVSALARRFSLGETVLPVFEAHTGIALDQFVLRRRIERALYLLKNSDASDREIAMGIGWGSAPDFQTAFTGYLGVSLTEYRRSLGLKQQATRVKSH